jgi:hypothetical protein
MTKNTTVIFFLSSLSYEKLSGSLERPCSVEFVIYPTRQMILVVMLLSMTSTFNLATFAKHLLGILQL